MRCSLAPAQCMPHPSVVQQKVARHRRVGRQGPVSISAVTDLNSRQQSSSKGAAFMAGRSSCIHKSLRAKLRKPVKQAVAYLGWLANGHASKERKLTVVDHLHTEGRIEKRHNRVCFASMNRKNMPCLAYSIHNGVWQQHAQGSSKLQTNMSSFSAHASLQTGSCSCHALS